VQDSMMGAVGEVEAAVGVPKGFFIKLVTKEDDWSFVIKLHALVEAALTHLLTVASENPTLDKVYALLETSDTKKGKLAFAREMGLLEDKYRRFVVCLSQTRNKLVHDVKNVGTTLAQLVTAMDSNQRAAFANDVSLGYDRTMDIQGTEVPLKKFVVENPKYGFWLGALDLLSDIYVQKERLALERDKVKFATRLWEASSWLSVQPPQSGQK
jgi:hypothetical protein